jgi:hypothetical protein
LREGKNEKRSFFDFLPSETPRNLFKVTASCAKSKAKKLVFFSACSSGTPRNLLKSHRLDSGDGFCLISEERGFLFRSVLPVPVVRFAAA